MTVNTVYVRAMRRKDVPAGLRLCRAASWNQLAADWELFLTASPDGCLVATDDRGEVVGTVATISYGTFSWIAMVLVDPSHRREGIGTKLLKESLDIVGVSTARLDATPAGRDVYVPLGFREEYGLQRMTRSAFACTTLPSFGETGRVRRMTDRDFIDVLTQDPGVFGGDRRMLLEMLRAQAPEYAWVAGESQIDGYVFGRHGDSFEHIGPAVARDESTARSLVGACLDIHADRAFVIDVPLQRSWTDWLVSMSFTLQRPFTRMCRGPGQFQERLDRIFAIAGPEFG